MKRKKKELTRIVDDIMMVMMRVTIVGPIQERFGCSSIETEGEKGEKALLTIGQDIDTLVCMDRN